MVAMLGTIGCGGAPSPTVVRIGDVSIDQRSVDHWSSAIARGAVVPNAAGPREAPRQQALALLISANWVIGEASRLGLRPSRAELVQTIERQERSLPSGLTEFKELLSASGETHADVELEARARWAAAKLAARLTSTVAELAKAQVSSAAVAGFYRAHAARYHLRERRYYDLIERIPSSAAASALAKRLGSGQRFAEDASKERPFRPTTFAGLPAQGVVYRAVFAAKVGVLTGPLPLQGFYALFVLRRIDPARVQSLAEVRGSIERVLLASAERRVRAQILTDFDRRWLAQTDCHPGYVVQKCRQYLGPRETEREPFAGY